MKVLIVAHEFPPNPSPQSLRWKYLSEGLSNLGHEVHVLTVDVLPPPVALALPEGVQVHKAFPGPLRGLEMAMVRRKQRRSPATEVEMTPGAAQQVDAPEHLNWKGRLFKRVMRWGGEAIFPDIRGEWLFPARRAFKDLLRRIGPDIVIASHEPATSLQVGRLAATAGVPWVADLGDPVLAPYTPRRWRTYARHLEAHVCRYADAITVTSQGTKQLLLERHGGDPSRISVLTQGYRRRPPRAKRDATGVLELLYSGRFYPFREPHELLAAVVATEGVRLSIASVDVPQVVLDHASRHPEKVRLLGFLPHEEILAAQQDADVLVNIGNEDPTQIPGKFFEYLGAGKPIVHLSQTPGSDEVAGIVVETGLGWVVENRRDAIAQQLDSIVHHSVAFAPSPEEKVLDYAWDRIAGRLEALLHSKITRHV